MKFTILTVHEDEYSLTELTGQSIVNFKFRKNGAKRQSDGIIKDKIKIFDEMMN
ncbi:hypothetical protein [Methanobrevibacter sp.]|uniref:hypothetical protein n=1 Tax=Methanobrevibacter sp. TaxID=66852 RepID=UPI00386E2A34